MQDSLLYFLFGSVINNSKRAKSITKSKNKLHEDTEIIKKDCSDLKSAILNCKNARISALKHL